MRFIFTERAVSVSPRGPPFGPKRKIKTFNAFFITHCHCPPLATPPTPPSAMRSVAYSVCSVDPSATLFVQATCLNKSSQPTPAPASPSHSAVVVLVFCGFPRFPRVIGCVLRGNLINCLATSTLLLFWHKILFYFYLPWPIFGGATSFFDSSISSRFSFRFLLPALLVFFIYFYVFII